MKLPVKIKVGGLDYKLQFVDGLADFGSTNFNKQVILIDKDLTNDNKVSTLVHEILEILNSQNDLNLTHQTISTLEAGLYQVIKDNF
jgi:hypothetical protein